MGPFDDPDMQANDRVSELMTERTREHLSRYKAKQDRAAKLARIRFWYWVTLLTVFLLQAASWGIMTIGRLSLGLDYRYASLMMMASTIVTVVCATQVVGRGQR